MTYFLKVLGTLLLSSIFLGQMSLAQATTELPTGSFPCRLQQTTSGVNAGSNPGEFEVMPSTSETMIGTLAIDRQTYTTNSGSGEYSFDGMTGELMWRSGPLEGWNSRLEQYSDGSFTVRFALERTGELPVNRQTGEILCDLPGAGEMQEGSSTAQISVSTLTPLAGDYPCRTSYFTYVSGAIGPTLIIQFNPSLLGTITLDGKGNYTVGDNTGTYVYSPASGFTFTRGSLAGWPTIFDTYDTGVELRLSSSQDEPPSPEGGSVGEHVCRLEVPGFVTATVTDGETGATGGTQPVTSINGGFTGTLTFRDNWTNEMIDDLELATGKVSGRFAGSDPHHSANGETVFINGQGAVVIVDEKGLVVMTFPSNDNGTGPQRPVFSNDGLLVAYTLAEPYYETHVIVRKRDSTKVADFINMIDPSWTPDARLVMASNTQYQDAPVGIFLSDAAFSTTARIDPDLDEAHDPAVSPDGQMVAFVYHGQIWLMGIDGSDPHQLAPFDKGAHSPAWSPDGQALVVLEAEYSEPYLVSLDGQVTKVQTDEGSGIQVSGQISWQQ